MSKRDAQRAFAKARRDRDDVAALAQRDRDAFQPPARRVFCRSRSTLRSAAVSPIPHCSRSAVLQAAQVARGIVHVGLANLDVTEAHDRIDFDRMALRALAHDLAMNLQFLRHVDDDDRRRCRAWQPSRRRRAERAALLDIDAARPRSTA